MSLFAVIGGVVVGLLTAGSAWLHYSASLTVPSRALRRRWHEETAPPRRR